MGSGFSKKKKQARMMQEQFAQLQEQLANTEVTGQAGNGLVSITLNGENQLKEIVIKPECVDPDDIEGLQDLIKAAHDDACAKLQEKSSGGLPGMPPMPGGFSF